MPGQRIVIAVIGNTLINTAIEVGVVVESNLESSNHEDDGWWDEHHSTLDIQALSDIQSHRIMRCDFPPTLTLVS